MSVDVTASTPSATWPAGRLLPDEPRAWPAHGQPGWLISMMGSMAPGRATQIELLSAWLQLHAFGVVRTSWNSSKLVSRTIAEARRQQTLTPQTYSILHAIDLAERIETELLPSLRSGYVVLADRYVFTALARDAARGVEREWLWNLYGFAVRPDLSIYLRIDTALSLERIRGVGGEASEAEALASAEAAGPLASFPAFQDAVTREYERLRHDLPIAGAGSVGADSPAAIGAAEPGRCTAGHRQRRGGRPMSTVATINDATAHSLQGRLDGFQHGYPGRLVVVEGGDRSGRSTQVQLLADWMSNADIPFVRTDWSTSPHISKAIHKAKAEGALRAFDLQPVLYAADFADRVENVIVPALQRGEVVLADRYVYTAFARDTARGADLRWLESLYGFAPLPDLVLYLRVPPDVDPATATECPGKGPRPVRSGVGPGTQQRSRGVVPLVSAAVLTRSMH